MITTFIISSWRRALLALAATAFLGTSCQRELVLPDVTVPDGQIVFGSEGLDLSVETKATEVTSLSSFYVSAVTGSAGSESSAWNSVQFSQVPGSSPASYAGGKYWPASNPGYKFYGSNVALNFAAGGTYVNASNATDVVCAYLSSPTYNTKNTLSFEHIFARLCRVDVAAQTGYTISNISMYITPKTGGTYNLRTGAGHTDGTGWSSVATGSATLISNKTGATNNDIYMVPGTYTITCSWVSTDPSGASVTHTNESSTLPIKGGATNNISVVLGGDIVLGVDLQDYCEYDYRDNLDYLTFYCDEAGTIGWKCTSLSTSKTIQYSKDFGTTWTNLSSSTYGSGATVSVSAGDIVWFKGSSAVYEDNNFTLSNKAHVYGNVNSLTGNNTSVSSNCFVELFSGCSNLYTYEHKKIILPATTLSNYCYERMFNGCTSLTTAPELPATTLANYCYDEMFSGCTSLTMAPELPATTLAKGCYYNMFNGCTSLIVAPELPAITMQEKCYNYMFSDCASLTETPELPATTLASSCYGSMFRNCTSLTMAPELPATTLASSCYNSIFRGCTSLTMAPELPATTLANSCYNSMFSGCTSLNYIKALFTSTPSSDYTSNWVSGVAPTGTFVKSESATWDVVGDDGVPTGWLVQKGTYDAKDNLNYLTFYCDEAGTIWWKCSNASVARTIQYSKDFGATWTNLTSTTDGATVSVNAGDIVWFKGSNTEYATSSSNYNQFTLSNKAHVYGNVNSLTGNNTSVSSYCFFRLFTDCSNLYTYESKKIILPATTLADYCYFNMFRDCSSLTYAPELPATTLASSCYKYMFYGCTSLKRAPELPATTLASNCYNSMFYGCTSLTTAPELPATTLASDCYRFMFQNCTSLTTVPELPATTLAESCYRSMFNSCTSLTTVPELPATTLASDCYRLMFQKCTSLTTVPNNLLPATTLAVSCYCLMFQGCTGLTTAPELPATTLAEGCYQETFNRCTSLTTAPELPATTLASNCYNSMFYGCTSLNYIKALFTSTPSSDYTSNWVFGVAPTGTFVKSESATWDVVGDDGVPTGWTVKRAAPEPLPGEFSVSATKKVRFAPGNLQAVIGGQLIDTYNYVASEWKFAGHQYDIIGDAAGNNSFAVGSTVDLFGWVGESASYDSYGLCTYTNINNVYYGTSDSDPIKTEWGSIPGVINSVGAGWSTLNVTENGYLFNSRPNASSKWGHGSINGINGMIILPDVWTLPANCSFSAGGSVWANAYTLDASGTSNAWVDMEAAGAVFLPAAGYRLGTSVYSVGSNGRYWSRSVCDVYDGYNVDFRSNRLSPQYENRRHYGHSVRLVKEAN